MFGLIKIIVTLLIVVLIGGGLWYAINLKAELAISQANEEKLRDGIKEQNELLESMKKDIAAIQEINKELSEQNARQKEDVNALVKKFDKRDLGVFASGQPDKMRGLVNRGTVNALRCIEIASGSPLNEVEKNAKTPAEANRECPQLINPVISPIN